MLSFPLVGYWYRLQRTQGGSLADRVADLANLDPDDRDAILHIVDGLIAKTASAPPSTSSTNS